jgi:hypothetical protein
VLAGDAPPSPSRRSQSLPSVRWCDINEAGPSSAEEDCAFAEWSSVPVHGLEALFGPWEDWLQGRRSGGYEAPDGVAGRARCLEPGEHSRRVTCIRRSLPKGPRLGAKVRQDAQAAMDALLKRAATAVASANQGPRNAS